MPSGTQTKRADSNSNIGLGNLFSTSIFAEEKEEEGQERCAENVKQAAQASISLLGLPAHFRPALSLFQTQQPDVGPFLLPIFEVDANALPFFLNYFAWQVIRAAFPAAENAIAHAHIQVAHLVPG